MDTESGTTATEHGPRSSGSAKPSTLDEHARLPTQTDAWTQAYRASYSVRVETVEVEGARAVLLRRGPLRELVGRHVLEPTDVVWRDEEAARDLAAALADTPIVVHRLVADSPLVSRMRALTRPAPPCPVVHLDERWLQQGGALSGRRASDLRRAARRADGLGGVEVEFQSPSPEAVEAAVARVAAVEDKSWKGVAGTSLVHDAARRSFFTNYARRAAADGVLRCAFLTIGGADAAAQLGVEWDNAYWPLKIGFDAKFAKCSPGQLLMLEAIRAAAARGLDRCEFLGVAAPWTEMWTRDARQTLSLLALPRTPRGLVAGGIVVAELARRRFR
jgi:CelD/BcsL family acetyltransferase involved in cellulose biosynthesis